MRAHARLKGRLRRALALVAITIAVGGLLLLLKTQALSLNRSASMPVGLYRRIATSHAPARGDMIEICAPPAIARFGAQRGYLHTGPCPFGTSPLLKYVGGISGDVIDVTPAAVRINGTTLPGSAATSLDNEGRPLPRIAAGRYVLRAGELWVWSPFPRGWDSRYYGALPSAGLQAIVRPVLTFGNRSAGARTRE